MDAGDWKEWPLPGPPKLRYTASDIAHWLDMDVKTLYRLIALGWFPEGIKDSPQAEPTWSGLDLACWQHLKGRWRPAEPDNGGQPGTAGDTGGQRRTSGKDAK